MILTEAAIIAACDAAKSISDTYRAYIQDPVLRDRMLKETEPFHQFVVAFNAFFGKIFVDILTPKQPLFPPAPPPGPPKP